MNDTSFEVSDKWEGSEVSKEIADEGSERENGGQLASMDSIGSN